MVHGTLAATRGNRAHTWRERDRIGSAKGLDGAGSGPEAPGTGARTEYGGGVTKEGTTQWPVRIRSPRLVIREPGDGDRAALIRLMTDPVTREYLGGAVDYASRQALELSPLGLTWGRWVLALAEDDTMIGSITLDYDRGELELSYALLPEWTGRGFAAESCIALLDWAQQELEDEHVIAISQTRNKRSVALLRKLGFTVRKGLEEFGAQQLLMERALREPLPAFEQPLQTAEDPPPPTRR